MGPDAARALYGEFLARLRSAYEADRVKDGVFGAMMKVSLVNDGPVTFILDSRAPAAAATPGGGASSGSLASAGVAGGGGNGGGGNGDAGTSTDG